MEEGLASRTYDWVLKPEEAEIVRRFIDEMLLPNSEKIRTLHRHGNIPVVIFEPMADMAAIFGGTLNEPILALSSKHKKALRKLPDSRPWVDKQVPRGMVKIFAVIHLGTYLCNWISGHELYIEPGSLDSEWKN